jgi:alkanesulfonate monooxygenase SsuD/methylene tetrahydromethanopterin reductase-like flavin-dependent oxidoreductase (luciferase family)
MKFLAMTLITHLPDPLTGIQKSTRERLREVVDNAILAEKLGFDGYGVGERHERPFISTHDTDEAKYVAGSSSLVRI